MISKKILSSVLALTMTASMLPTNLTAVAVDPPATVTITPDKSKADLQGSGSLTITLKIKQDITPTVSLTDWQYKGTPSTPVVDGNSGNGTVTYQYKSRGADDSTYTDTVPTSVGEYTVKADIAETDDYKAGSATADFEIKPYTTGLTITLKIKQSITPTVSLTGWTYGDTANTPTVSGNEGNGTVTYKYKLKSDNDEAYSASVPTAAGKYTVKAVIAETSEYKGGEATADFTIAKADPTPEAVTDLNAIYEQTLADVTLPTANDGTWAWKDPTTTSVGNAGTHTFTAVFTPTNTNYNTVEQNVTVNVAKANMTPNPVSERNATYGQTLSDVTLPATNNGTWAWKDPTTTSVGNAGTHTFKAVFTPTNTNYNTVEQIVTVNVAKADPTPDEVTDLTAAYGKTLEDVALPNGWTWDAPETSVGNVGDNAFAATYTPDDTANYNTLNQDLTVTVVPVNKTALNDALTNANNYLDTIKNDADYEAPSSDLSTAISTVNAVLTNDNVTEACKQRCYNCKV